MKAISIAVFIGCNKPYGSRTKEKYKKPKPLKCMAPAYNAKTGLRRLWTSWELIKPIGA